MARPLRIERAGSWYHLTARGNERRDIYRDNEDRLKFLALQESKGQISFFCTMQLLSEILPLRIEQAASWYRLTARGNERRDIFRDDDDRLKFLALLEAWVERYRLRLHAYVLMNNHYHLLAETVEANLSQATALLSNAKT